MKTCSACHVSKPISEFPPNKKNKDGLNRKCRPCFNQYMRNWYTKNKDVHLARIKSKRQNYRAARYGLTVVEVDSMHALYNGKCHLCKKNEATDIDHCHQTNRVRGILCNGCNTSLGKLGDTPESIQKALDYVSKDRTPIQV